MGDLRWRHALTASMSCSEGDNSIDEFIMGEGKEIEITRDEDSVSIRDFVRIPLGKVVDCVSQINTGGKYNDDVFQFPVGLNGVGTKAVNALSSDFEVICTDGVFMRARFEKGVLVEKKKGKASDAVNGTHISFTPDRELFRKYQWQEDFIIKRLQYYAFLMRD